MNPFLSASKYTIKPLVIFIAIVTTTPIMSLNLGAKVGASLANKIYASNSDNNGSKIGLIAGVFSIIELNDFISFMPEVDYAQKGNKQTQTTTKNILGEPTTQITITNSLDYIDIFLPIGVRFDFLKELTFYAGPNVGVNVRASKTAEKDGESQTEDISGFVQNQILQFSTGVQFVFMNNLYFDLRYTMGLPGMLESQTSAIDTISFLVGYGINL